MTYYTIDIIEYLESLGIDIDPICLQIACITANTELIKYFIRGDVNINYQDAQGETALIGYVASVKNNYERSEDVIKFMLEHGADKTIVDIKGKTAYDYAKENYPELADILKPLAIKC